jgi:hypothetical protein
MKLKLYLKAAMFDREESKIAVVVVVANGKGN